MIWKGEGMKLKKGRIKNINNNNNNNNNDTKILKNIIDLIQWMGMKIEMNLFSPLRRRDYGIQPETSLLIFKYADLWENVGKVL